MTRYTPLENTVLQLQFLNLHEVQEDFRSHASFSSERQEYIGRAGWWQRQVHFSRCFDQERDVATFAAIIDRQAKIEGPKIVPVSPLQHGTT